MAEKNTIIFYTDWADDFEYLEPQEAKELILAIFDYRLGKEPHFSSRVVEGVFRHISKQIDKDTEKWEEVCKTRSENGKKGGRPKKAKKPNGFEKNQNKPNGFEKTEQKLMQPKKADNEYEYEYEYEYDNEYDNDLLDVVVSNTDIKPCNELDEIARQEIINEWNKQRCTQNIKVIPIGLRRENNTRLCIQQDYQSFISTIRDIDNQAYFQEKADNNDFITYDWFVEPNNYLKIVEGNYKDKRREKMTLAEQIEADGKKLEGIC